MSDRAAEARSEVQRRWNWPHTRKSDDEMTPKDWLDEGMSSGFVLGAQWADANPQPRTITRKELNTAMLRAPRGSGAAGVLAQLGIEVTDDE